MHDANRAREFTGMIHPHLPRLHHLGLKLTRDTAEAEELVQETLTRAWTHWSRFDASGNLGAWLARIAFNTFVSGQRHAKVVQRTAARPDVPALLHDRGRMDAAAAPETAWFQHELSDEVQAALDQLPLHYRRVVELVDLRGVPYREAAAHLEVPVGTVMSRLHRARRLLRHQLEGFAREFGFGGSALAAA
jgi:RNA polymerase sigma-70 factor (ECF subfamily)